MWRKAWADFTVNDFWRGTEVPERIDHRSNAERGIDEIPTVAACQMEKKGIATEKGELNRNSTKRQTALSGKSGADWEAQRVDCRPVQSAGNRPEAAAAISQPRKSVDEYLRFREEKSRKYSQRWQQQHTADELKTIAAAVNYLSEHGISNLDELDASLPSVSDKAYPIRDGMKTAEQRMKELQKLMEYGRNYHTKAHTGRVSANPLERKTGEVCGSPPRRAYPMGRGKPLSPCKSAERNKDLAYCGMGTGIC